jgi:lipoprotein-anchoring transpeptidase ErfK/SrfK
VTSHRLLVHRDGEQVAEYPASYGSGRDANRTTRSGIHVVSEFHEQKRMVSERYDYDVTVDWAVRISNNGEFIHASEDTLPEQGEENVTHGCINLAPGDAKAFYDSALYGDPVEVSGSPLELSEADGDISDWTLTWQEWQGLSAL